MATDLTTMMATKLVVTHCEYAEQRDDMHLSQKVSTLPGMMCSKTPLFLEFSIQCFQTTVDYR
jgi:hypothetical protein